MPQTTPRRRCRPDGPSFGELPLSSEDLNTATRFGTRVREIVGKRPTISNVANTAGRVGKCLVFQALTASVSSAERPPVVRTALGDVLTSIPHRCPEQSMMADQTAFPVPSSVPYPARPGRPRRLGDHRDLSRAGPLCATVVAWGLRNSSKGPRRSSPSPAILIALLGWAVWFFRDPHRLLPVKTLLAR